MGIFTGIEILFFTLGVLTTLGILGLVHLKNTRSAEPLSLALAALSLSLFLFALAWCVSSILEHEHQAANMGILFFGLPAILTGGMAWKKLPAIGQETN